MAASSLELDWTESDLSSSPEPADKNGEKESSKTDEHEVINSALSGPLSASTPKKCREDRYASYTEISFGSEELSRPSVEISFGSEHSEPALIPLDFGQSSGLSSVGSSSTALGNKSVSLDFSYDLSCNNDSVNDDIPESIQQIESLIETEELSASGRNFMQQDKQIPD